MEWCDETIVRLRIFWDEGLSTAEIGRRLGISKNAVVGKAHRLTLTARPSPIRRDGAVAARTPPLPRVVGSTLPPLPAGTGAANVGGRKAAAAGPPSEKPSLPDGPAPTVCREAIARDAEAPEQGSRPGVQEVLSRPAEPAAGTVIRVVAAASRRQAACCWPLGEPGTKSFRFCDASALPAKPYCAEHAQVAYVKVRDRREEAA